MRVFLFVVVTVAAVRAALTVARAISGARLNHALRALAPTAEDVAAVMSETRADAPPMTYAAAGRSWEPKPSPGGSRILPTTA
jgi:hypothetical protein